ncbi:DUF6314 family protein [Wenxinia saemankumensis]|uniref:DUF6314 domain-containing protein n=1 Tax=Wenxinia saemankumensis TaxID=1447782 RepID=A0A1M6EY42_9RHOB|nr:DUF6314 family protein [Wenxinia saemankumensis]SHI90309.1 hypothetical protein SAMN05444417_2239 [Wenxinia saemankumensis]
MDELGALRPFLGDWQLVRRVRDGGDEARFEGSARLGADGWFVESGTWTSGSMAGLRGERRTHWAPLDAGIAVSFADGRPFHHVVPGTGEIAVRHDCAPDLYLGAYRFELPALWRLDWRVTGPRKDYRMTSTYRRA